MGISGMSLWQLLIVFGIAILIFGTSRLKNIGGDLGGAIKGFRKAMDTDESESSRPASASTEAARVEGPGKSAQGLQQGTETANRL